MAVSSPPRGLIIDLITPLKESGDIDGTGLRRHLDRVVPHVQAVFLASPHMGEGDSLSSGQLEQLLEITLETADGRVPLLIWISRKNREETEGTLSLLQNRRKQQKYSGPIYWVDTPLLYHSNRGLPSHYRDLSSTVGEPFLLYNDPELVKGSARPLKRNNIRTGVLKGLAEEENIRGVIFLGSLDRANNYQRAVRSRSDFRIYDGDESHFLRHPSRSGVVSVGANLSPWAWKKITESSLNMGRGRNDYPDHQYQIWELGTYLQKMRDLYRGVSVPLVKKVLCDMGIIESPTCHSENGALQEKVEQLKELMRGYGDY